MQSYPPRALDRRLQEDWAKDAREGLRVLMSLRFDCSRMEKEKDEWRHHFKEQRTPLMKKIQGLQAPMELHQVVIRAQELQVGAP
ncbi:hypothetical protein HKD37_20G056021 [Glycine soja]